MSMTGLLLRIAWTFIILVATAIGFVYYSWMSLVLLIVLPLIWQRGEF